MKDMITPSVLNLIRPPHDNLSMILYYLYLYKCYIAIAQPNFKIVIGECRGIFFIKSICTVPNITYNGMECVNINCCISEARGI